MSSSISVVFGSIGYGSFELSGTWSLFQKIWPSMLSFFCRFLKPVPSFLAPNGGVKVRPDFSEIQKSGSLRSTCFFFFFFFQ